MRLLRLHGRTQTECPTSGTERESLGARPSAVNKSHALQQDGLPRHHHGTGLCREGDAAAGKGSVPARGGGSTTST